MAGINKGDTVVLKSGSPIMTVQDIGDYSHQGIEKGALCVWFKNSEPMERVFDLESLKLYRDEF